MKIVVLKTNQQDGGRARNFHDLTAGEAKLLPIAPSKDNAPPVGTQFTTSGAAGPTWDDRLMNALSYWTLMVRVAVAVERAPALSTRPKVKT